MPRGRVIILAAVIALVSIIATALVFLFLIPALPSGGLIRDVGGEGGRARETVFDPGETVQVLVALQRLPRGFVIPDNALDNAVGVREWPAAAVPVDAIIVEAGQSPAEVVNEQVIGRVTRTDIEREQPILRTLLAESLSDLAPVGSDTAAILPQGMVAISLPIDKLSGVAYAIRPGDHVDLIFSFVVLDVDDEFQTALPNWVFELEYGAFTEEGTRVTAKITPLDGAVLGRLDTIPPDELVNIVPSELQRPRLVSQRAIEDALVLYVGEYPLDGQIVGILPNEVDPGDEGQPTARIPPDVITLGVTPQQAVVITWALKAQVDVNLVLRPVQGLPNVATSSVTLQYLFETYNVTLPPRLPYSLEPSLRLPPLVPGSSPED